MPITACSVGVETAISTTVAALASLNVITMRTFVEIVKHYMTNCCGSIVYSVDAGGTWLTLSDDARDANHAPERNCPNF